MTTQTTVVLSSDLWKILHDAGLAPDQCTDIIIEARVGQAVKIHYAAFPGDSLPKVIAAFAQQAKVVDSEDTP